MRSQLHETFRVLGLSGRVVGRTPSSALVELGTSGFVSVMANCEGVYDCVITLSVPKSLLAPGAIAEIKRQICVFFDIDENSKIAVKLCEPIRIESLQHQNVDTAGIYVAELAEAPHSMQSSGVYGGSPYDSQRYPDVKPLELVRSYLEAEPEEGLYSVPRRYDLASMFAISVAYALLFSILRALDVDPAGISLAGIFVAIVGAAQALMFGGKKPREASVIAGTIGGFLCVVAYSFALDMRSDHAVGSALCSVLWCPFVGYLTGTMIGGIWLIADYLRQWLEGRKNSNTTENDGSVETADTHVLDEPS